MCDSFALEKKTKKKSSGTERKLLQRCNNEGVCKRIGNKEIGSYTTYHVVYKKDHSRATVSLVPWLV